jgi:hypothetical protein
VELLILAAVALGLLALNAARKKSPGESPSGPGDSASTYRGSSGVWNETPRTTPPPHDSIHATSQTGINTIDVDPRQREVSERGSFVGTYDPSMRSVTGPGLVTGSYASDGRIYNAAGIEIGRVDHDTGRVYISSGNDIGSVSNTSDPDASSAAAFRLLDNLNC